MESSVILIDCDGPVLDFDGSLLKEIRPETTVDEIKNLNEWDIFKLFDDEQLKKTHKLLKKGEFWNSIPVHDHAINAVEKMRSVGGEIIFLTSPWVSCKNWEYIRREKLKKTFKISNEQFISTRRKELVYGDVFIDDKLENVEKWHERWKYYRCYAILFETLTNYKSLWYPRIYASMGKSWKLATAGTESRLSEFFGEKNG